MAERSIIDDIYTETLPWTLDHGVTDEHNNSAIVDEHRVVVAFMSDDGLGEEDANEIIDARGRLMAAAPEMVQALLLIVSSGVSLPVEITEKVEASLDKVYGRDV